MPYHVQKSLNWKNWWKKEKVQQESCTAWKTVEKRINRISKLPDIRQLTSAGHQTVSLAYSRRLLMYIICWPWFPELLVWKHLKTISLIYLRRVMYLYSSPEFPDPARITAHRQSVHILDKKDQSCGSGSQCFGRIRCRSLKMLGSASGCFVRVRIRFLKKLVTDPVFIRDPKSTEWSNPDLGVRLNIKIRIIEPGSEI